jgi:16S rRNA (guanine966-N2)-methyltransferase
MTEEWEKWLVDPASAMRDDEGRKGVPGPAGGSARHVGAGSGKLRPGQRNSVRIVAGARRSRRLRVPSGDTVRPTAEMVREAVFDSLGPVTGLTALDLFAGSGAMGLEALSRGVERCVFVEQDRRVAEVLRQNIDDLEYRAESRVIVADYRAALQELGRLGQRFDLLFVDPPYKMLPEAEVTLGPIVPGIVNDGGVVVLESDKGSHPTLGALPVFDRVYGDTRVTMVTIRVPRAL